RVLIVQSGKGHHNGTQQGLSSPFPSDSPARRKRTATVSPFVSTQMFCGPDWPRQKAALDASVRETNRRTFGHGVVPIHSGSYWIINTLEGKKYLYKWQKGSSDI
ncbi:hypothetical protein P4S87_26120, partial [Aneurinibacillus aneurinilyticus]|uniref:hypothetical protein n=1 Tax=Aneurinibacillus aneurinilyticus TaxID=1391 RepID=UPI002E1B7F25|nr:hypothetical protein [Aneurinibacillus aneurinilyticus]